MVGDGLSDSLSNRQSFLLELGRVDQGDEGELTSSRLAARVVKGRDWSRGCRRRGRVWVKRAPLRLSRPPSRLCSIPP